MKNKVTEPGIGNPYEKSLGPTFSDGTDLNEQENKAYEAERDEAYKHGWIPPRKPPYTTPGEYLKEKGIESPLERYRKSKKEKTNYDSFTDEEAEAREVFGLPRKESSPYGGHWNEGYSREEMDTLKKKAPKEAPSISDSQISSLNGMLGNAMSDEEFRKAIEAEPGLKAFFLKLLKA